jgi:hypothetical protein
LVTSLTRGSKTQIALEYAYSLRKACEGLSVFWVHASNTERFRQSYALIAQEGRIHGYNDPKIALLPLVKKWLEKSDRGRWLMIIDNADDSRIFFPPEESDTESDIDNDSFFGQYIPDCSRGSILITTRNKQAGLMLTRGRPQFAVHAMDSNESEQLLRRQLGTQDLVSDQLLTLASRLEYLPLALAQAAAYIEANSITVDRYLQLIDKGNQDFINLLSKEFETVGRDSETPRAVTKTWTISFRLIQKQNALAGELLSLMSFFDRQAIVMEFLTWYTEQQANGKYGEQQIEEALGLLKAFSFITQVKDQSLDIHRLVQLVMKKWLYKEKKTNYFAGQAIIAVSHFFPFGNYDNWVACNALLPHVYSVLKLEGPYSRDQKVGRATLLTNVGTFFYFQGELDDSERLF